MRTLTTVKNRIPTLAAEASSPQPTASPHPAGTNLEATVLKTWATRFGGRDELLLVATSHGHADRLNESARAALQAIGRLTGPTARAGDPELAVGDRVVAGSGGIPRPGELGIPEGCPGDVRLVTSGGQAVVIDFPTAGVLRLTGPQLANARLRYGYATPAAPGFGQRIGSIRVAIPARTGLDVTGA